MKVKFLKIKNLLLVGTMTMLGLPACKKEPAQPDRGEIVPCYGVITADYCAAPGVNGESNMSPANQQMTYKNED